MPGPSMNSRENMSSTPSRQEEKTLREIAAVLDTTGPHRKPGQPVRTLSAEEWLKETEAIQGYDGPLPDDPEYLQTWDPKERAATTPAPLLLSPGLRYEAREFHWDPVLDLLRGREYWFILGAGASLLEMDLTPLNEEVVYGINWTREWFEPTFLQAVDRAVIQSQVARKPGDFKFVTSRWAALNVVKDYETEHVAPLWFEQHHPGIASRAHLFFFAEEPRQPMAWYHNSLGWALNVAYWFRPKKIILLGFDWGGLHFFGDGKTRGSQQNYGLAGTDRPTTIPKLSRLREELEERGMDIRQVGPTKLPVFADRVFPSLEEAMA